MMPRIGSDRIAARSQVMPKAHHLQKSSLNTAFDPGASAGRCHETPSSLMIAGGRRTMIQASRRGQDCLPHRKNLLENLSKFS